MPKGAHGFLSKPTNWFHMGISSNEISSPGTSQKFRLGLKGGTMPRAKERDGVFQRKDRSGWWVSYVDASGKRKKEKVTAHTRTQAMTALSQIKTRIERESILGVKSASEITTADLLKRFKTHQKAHLRPTTFVRLDGILETLKTALPVLAKEITRQAVADYILKRSETVSAGTVAKEFATLRHALQLAVEWELLTVNPAQGAKLPKVSEGRTRYLSPTEFKAALEAAPDWMRGPMALAAFTGMRRGEILGLCWKDVDLENQRVYLTETKNGTLRVLALNGLAVQVLKSLPEGNPGELVFPEVNGAHLSVYTRRVFASVGIEDASFHSLRHTAASWLVMEGVDLYAVGRILGHKTPRMTQRYAHLSPGYMAAAVNKLDGVFAGALPEPK
jgi:integrase